MHIVTNGRNIELTQAIKDYVQQKISRMEKHFEFIQEIHVILEVEKNPSIADNHLAEATVHIPGAILRVEAASDNLYASIDKLADKIERAVNKHKSKLQHRNGAKSHDTIRREGIGTEALGMEEEDFEAAYAEETEPSADLEIEFADEEPVASIES
jgi:putative sigma-54 modulation protein